jgi:hypothetical protein
MQRHTVDADPWYRCDACGHIFAVQNDGWRAGREWVDS